MSKVLREIVIEDLHKRSADYQEIQIEDVDFGLEYLTFYGYVAKPPEGSFALLSIQDAVKEFQEYFDLDPDGEMGPKTLRAMSLPRCNMKDVGHLEKYGWDRNNLNYFIEAYLSDLEREEYETIIDLAFKAWEDVCDLTINRTNNKSNANLVVGVGSGRRDGFDGPSGTLAWNEIPSRNTNQVRGAFDKAETWTGRKGGRGIRLFNVASHEFGHGLGLVHSKTRGALMAPYYSPDVAFPQKNDDIPRIQSIYGPPKNQPVPTPTPDPTPTNPNNLTRIILEIDGVLKNVELPGFRVSRIN
jgi:hypothetical protein